VQHLHVSTIDTYPIVEWNQALEISTVHWPSFGIHFDSITRLYLDGLDRIM